ncbi:bifunctional adenosylcobinamide kinase/adenosylcobinamide-phosphate guanylyltransferase [Candidatus Aerophobetes bacterium]|nr:bifunctional adenosylcobinamide kinase/adenosylcobinamide-phosphate guanylyltransferase [Candidatus Aerophobetes bacterium]
MPELILVTGGTRSGKSRFAIELASSFSEKVIFIATAPRNVDEEMEKRIKKHRFSRPSWWEVVEEEKDVASHLARINSPEYAVIIDCLTLLISNLLIEGKKEEEILNDVGKIADLGRKTGRATIIVSNEVGWGVVPATNLGREFRDIAGLANKLIASKADRVYLLVCGIPLKLKGKE